MGGFVWCPERLGNRLGRSRLLLRGNKLASYQTFLGVPYNGPRLVRLKCLTSEGVSLRTQLFKIAPASIGTDRTVFDVCSHFVRKHCNSSGYYLRRNGYEKLTNKMQTYVANVEDGSIGSN